MLAIGCILYKQELLQAAIDKKKICEHKFPHPQMIGGASTIVLAQLHSQLTMCVVFFFRLTKHL